MSLYDLAWFKWRVGLGCGKLNAWHWHHPACPSEQDAVRRMARAGYFGLVHVDHDIMAPSSMGEDAGLSSRRAGFESQRGQK